MLSTTEPEGVTTLNRSFSGCNELVWDGKNNLWPYTYGDQPGLITVTTDPAGDAAAHQCDALARQGDELQL